jgi:hypothetical protein
MTEETIEETEAELTPDRLDDYLVAAASVVEELRDFVVRTPRRTDRC